MTFGSKTSINNKLIAYMLFILLGIGIFLSFNIKETKALSSSPTGSCGFLLTRSLFGYDAYMIRSNGVGSSINGVINYDAGTFTGKITTINNYGLSNAYDSTDTVIGSITSESNAIPSSYKITLNYTTGSGDSGSIQFVDTITNGGSTGLIKSIPVAGNNTGAWSGYCIAL